MAKLTEGHWECLLSQWSGIVWVTPIYDASTAKNIFQPQ